MARKSKYCQDLADKIIELAEQGYCLKDVAYFCGLSDRTILRWREQHLDFNEAFAKATQRSVENIDAIKRLGHRTYQRKTYISPNYGQKTAQIGSKSLTGASFLSEKPYLVWLTYSP